MSLSIRLQIQSDLIRSGLEKIISSASEMVLVNDDIPHPDVVIGDPHVSPDLHERLMLILEETSDHSGIRKLVNNGIKGALTIHCSEKEILHAIESVGRHERFFCHKVLEVMLENPASAVITEREKEVLELIARGETTDEIARALTISVHTVNSHRKNMLKKLNLKSPVQLVAYAVNHNLIQLPH